MAKTWGKGAAKIFVGLLFFWPSNWGLHWRKPPPFLAYSNSFGSYLQLCSCNLGSGMAKTWGKGAANIFVGLLFFWPSNWGLYWHEPPLFLAYSNSFRSYLQLCSCNLGSGVMKIWEKVASKILRFLTSKKNYSFELKLLSWASPPPDPLLTVRCCKS